MIWNEHGVQQPGEGTGLRPGVVLDLDDTLVDTSALRPYRDRRDWKGARAAVAHSLLYADMAEFLNELKLRDVPVAVVTNSPSAYANFVMDHHRIIIPTKICYHDVTRRKPDPEPVTLAMKRAGISVEGSIGIGDTAADQKAYKAAGLVAVGAAWSLALDASADWDVVIDSPLQAVGLLDLATAAD